jgi:iron complex outermembrane receptor protein
VFGQVEYDFNEDLTGILGLRWIQDDKSHVFEVNAVDFIDGTTKRNGNPNILANIASYSGDRKDDEVSVRLALNYRINEDVMVYGSWNRGVKGGGYNSPVFPLSPPLDYTDDVMSYDPEQLDAFEVGFKSSLGDGLAFLNGAIYYYDYQDYQAFQIIGLDTITQNAEAESYGGELELQTSPTEGLDLIFGVAYNDIDVDLAGFDTTSVQSPKWNLNGLARYQWAALDGTLAVQMDAQYRSKHYFALTLLETVEEKGYTVANASVSYTSGDERWNIMGFVHNLSDEEYLVQTFDLSGPDVFGMVEQYYGKPRWYGVSVSLNW